MEPRETMKEKVYLDSTIPSYYFNNRESLAASGQSHQNITIYF